MKLGDFYWSDAEEPSKFLIVYECTNRGEQYFVAVKCYAGSYDPITEPEHAYVAWFDRSGLIIGDVGLRLIRKARKPSIKAACP